MIKRYRDTLSVFGLEEDAEGEHVDYLEYKKLYDFVMKLNLDEGEEYELKELVDE